MFFTMKPHSRIFGFGKSKHYKDPFDTNLGSRIKAVLLDKMCEIPLCRSDRFLYTAIPGKTSSLPACSLLFDSTFSRPKPHSSGKVEEYCLGRSKKGMSKLLCYPDVPARWQIRPRMSTQH
jgi:hypothetical protein